MHAQHEALGAVFYEAAGWERPQWFEANAPLVEKYGVETRPHEWDARWWSPIINAEHLAMREHAGLFDLSAFAIFDVGGSGALEGLQRIAARQMDVPVGRVVYTPLLSPNGGFKSDLTIMRLGDDLFRVVTGGAHGMADKKWFRDHLPQDGSVTLVDVTTAWTTIGLWGPRARDILSSVTRDDVSHEGFKFGTCRTIEIGSQLALASRISYVGDLGWEFYVPIEQGARLWDVLWQAGQPHGLTACGIGVYGTTGRLEKGYRAYGAELETEYDVVEAGMHGRGQGAGLHRQGGAPAPSRRRARRHPLHAHGRRPHLGRAASSATRSAASRSRCATARRSPTPRGAGRTSPAPAPARRSAATSCSPTCRPSTPSRVRRSSRWNT